MVDKILLKNYDTFMNEAENSDFPELRPGLVTTSAIAEVANRIVQRLENGEPFMNIQRQLRGFMEKALGHNFNADVDHISSCVWQTVASLLAKKVQKKE